MFEVGIGTSRFPVFEISVSKKDPERLSGSRGFQIFLKQIRDLGISLVDTAPLYGANEQNLGRYADLRSFRVCTKFGLEPSRDFGSTVVSVLINNILGVFLKGGPPRRVSFSAKNLEDVRFYLERSKKRLRVPAVDTFLYHAAESAEQLDQVSPILTELRHAGLVRRVGFSSDTFFEADTSWCDVVQVPAKGVNWFEGDFDLMINRIFSDGNNGDLSQIQKINHANRLVQLLIGSSKIERVVDFKRQVDSF